MGSKLLSEADYLNVNLKIMPLSVTNCDFETEFESQGINQTKYKIYITIESNVRVLQPFSAENFKIKNKMLISEVVIVGEVPDSYVNVPENNILMQRINNLWYTNVMLRFNENNEIITEEKYRAILVGLQRKEDISYSMEELAGLAEAANAEVLGKVVQVLEKPNTATMIERAK